MTKTVNVFIRKSDHLDFDFVGNSLDNCPQRSFFPVQLSQKDLLVINSEAEGSRSSVHTKFEMQLRPVTSAADQAVLFSSAFTVMYAVKTRFTAVYIFWGSYWQ